MQLTQNFNCFVTKGEQFFAVHNLKNNNVDGGYPLSERAYFEDDGQRYSVTVFKNGPEGNYSFDLRKEV